MMHAYVRRKKFESSMLAAEIGNVIATMLASMFASPKSAPDTAPTARRQSPSGEQKVRSSELFAMMGVTF